ncbi:MAG TPA: aminotransferase class I/II-fold pyridoxal phosphate-dependent enzyme [Acidimicrobiia bacterium]|jgi:7-keto-8-aminopelargonate synthetase-like enzyme
MRAGTATQHERLMRVHRRHADRATEAGLTGLRFSDVGDGSIIRVDDRDLVNFGNCSYLGLSVDPRLKQGAIEAIERFGPLYASSQMYAAVELYNELEQLLAEMTDARAVVLPPTTTLGHLATLPSLVGTDDVVVLDSHSHASLQLTVQVLAGRGIQICPVPHNDMRRLTEAVDEAASRHPRVWYIADGVYSMMGDFAPVEEISALKNRYPNLYVYYDDAHGFSWRGEKGRGFVLENVTLDEQTIVAAGLGKAFGTGGAAIFFGDPELALTVKRIGGPMTFSGPIHPPTLGAAIAAARIHLSDEYLILRRRMADQIKLVTALLAEHRLPVTSWAPTPIWQVRVGDFDRMLELTRRMLDDGYYVNPTAFPVVPHGHAGIRFTHTLNNTDDQIRGMVERLSANYRAVVGEPDTVVDLTEMEGGPGVVSASSAGA